MTDAPGSVQAGATDGQVLGDFRIFRTLGSGGMGEVYEALDRSSGRRVALKVMNHRLDSETDRRRFLREGRLAAAVSHPNAVYIFGSEEIEGRPVIVMELVRAGTLKERVEKEGPLPVAEAVDAILQVIAGLEAAAAAGVLHRDIKPANCFVDSDGTVKIGDFGLSISTQARPESMLTATGTLMGTPSFASPEQLRGEPLDVASDIYGVGATLYFLLTGRTPLGGRDLVQVITRVLEESPEPPRSVRPEIPGGLSRAVLRCLAKSRDARYADYQALRRALTPWSSAAPSPATLARRTGAGLLDSLVTSLLYLPAFLADAPESLLNRTPEGVGSAAVIVVLLMLYYAVPEAVWGATPGKAALGLRVVGRSGGPPPMRRALARSLLFNAPEYLPPLLLLPFVSPAEFAADEDRIYGYMFLFIITILIGLFATARRRNGFAAVHDLLTDTRVVGRAVVQRGSLAALRGEGADESEDGETEPPTPVGDASRRFGPYVVTETYGEAEGRRFHLGRDTVLHRQMVIVEHPPGGPGISPHRRDLARKTRLRWLGGERSDEGSWDAYELPEGRSLTGDGSPNEWPRVSSWLRDLTEELGAGLEEPEVAPAVSVDRVWITRDGRVLLLDFPAPGVPPHAAADARVLRGPGELQHFLHHVAGAARSGPGAPGPRGEEPGPLSPGVTAFLASLEEESFATPDALLGSLERMQHQPSKVTVSRRLASLTIPVALLVLSAVLGWTIEREFDEAWALEHPDLTSPALLAEVWSDADEDSAEVRAAVRSVVAARYGAILIDSAFWQNEEMPSGLRRFRPVASTWLENDGPDPAELARADSVLAPELRWQHQSELLKAIYLLPGLLIAVGGSISAVCALVFARLPLLGLFGIAVVDRRGRRAGRFRLLTRTVLGWLLAMVVLVTTWLLSVRALASGVARVEAGRELPLLLSLLPQPLRDAWPLFLALSVLALVVAGLARFPRRGPQDRITRTWLVPI